MNIWNVLNMEPTTEIREVKRAYAKLLKQNHPEENPQGYQRLREAYSAALDFIKGQAESAASSYHTAGNPPVELPEVPSDSTNYEEEEESEQFYPQDIATLPPLTHEFDEFMELVFSAYDNPDTRSNINCWQELMNHETVSKLANREMLGYRMKDFLMSHYLLPKEVWELLDGYFYFSELDEVLLAFVKQNLYIAVRSGSMNAVRCLLENGADLEVTNKQGKTALVYAAKYGYSDILEELLLHNVNLEAKGTDGRTALIEAILNEEPEIVKCLLAKGADYNTTDKNGKTALMYAAESDDRTALELLLELNLDLEITENLNGKTALIYAVISKNEEGVELLLQHGANAKVKNALGFSAFFSAANSGNVRILQMLHEHGADINEVDEEGITALTLAVKQNAACTEYLIERGAHLDATYNDMDLFEVAAGSNQLEPLKVLIELGVKKKELPDKLNSILMFSSICGFVDIMKYVIELGASVNDSVFDEDLERDCTPLFYAAKNGNEEATALLLEYGADASILNIIYSSSAGMLDRVKYLVEEKKADVNDVDEKDGKTALILAAKNGKRNIVKYLVEQGANCNVTDYKLSSPLIEAALNGDVEMMDFLLQNGADINLKTADGFTALFRCASESKIAGMEYLIAKGADLEAKDKRGYTPLLAAIIYERDEAVELLIQKGADIFVVDDEEYNAFTYAVAVNHLGAAKLLVKHGADIHCIDHKGRTYLHLAAVFGSLELVKYLRQLGLSLNDRGNDGNTVLLEAAENDNLNVVKYIVEEETDYDINAKNSEGKKAINFAMENSNAEMVNTLMSADTDLDLSVDEMLSMIDQLKSLL